MKTLKDWKNVIYMSVAMGMLIYAAPRLEVGQGATLPTIFGIVWIAFALLIVAAHLHRILGVDEETRQELARVRKHSRWQREQWVRGILHSANGKK